MGYSRSRKDGWTWRSIFVRILKVLGSQKSIGADAAIVFFDFCSKVSYKNAAKYLKDITKVCGNIPITLVGNKFDAETKKIRPSAITLHKKKGLSFFCVSTKDGYQIEQPFLSLLRKLKKNDDLTFLAEDSHEDELEKYHLSMTETEQE